MVDLDSLAKFFESIVNILEQHGGADLNSYSRSECSFTDLS